ncbi:hypothetical protein DL93DRAFT_346410 [Clavulina sp. PMI_390]|nr:hypothetical protein DL93DRAFT_346410 [Clavulina sp. PMI_390]
MLPLDIMIWKHPVLSICSRWRSCVVNTPHIWSYIYISSGNEASARTEGWFRRSGGLPLTLIVRDIRAFNFLQESWLTMQPSPSQRIRDLCIRNMSFLAPCPLPLAFDATNLERLEIEFSIFSLERGKGPTFPLKLFDKHAPVQLQSLQLRSHRRWPRTIDPTGLDPSHLVSLVLGDEIPYDDVLVILKYAPHLERLNWDLPGRQNPQLSQTPAAAGRPRWLAIPALQRMYLRTNGGPDPLEFMDAPSLTCLSYLAHRLDRMIHSLISFASSARELTHLKISDGHHPVTDTDVATIFHAFPKLEYFDPTWRNSNVRGILALCGEFPEPVTPNAHSSSWACPTVRSLYLPIDDRLRQKSLTKDILSACLGRLLDVRGRGSSSSTSNGTLLAPDSSAAAASRFSIVVDAEIRTMVSILGEKWDQYGGICVEELEFPET